MAKQGANAPKHHFQPKQFDHDVSASIQDVAGYHWAPLFSHPCGFGMDIFSEVMMNLIRNPNINSSWLFRADILLEQNTGQDQAQLPLSGPDFEPYLTQFQNFTLDKLLVRRLIPRNTLRDDPLDQTCLVYHGTEPTEGATTRSLVVYRPHLSSPSEVPFYHPRVRGLGFMHEWDSSSERGVISIHYAFFEDEAQPPPEKLVRTGLHLLSTLHKHGEGSLAGYVKRVHHDTVVPQIELQTTYARLKREYARELIRTWAEVTDPDKHVFEDLSIAAFLIELWSQMYKDSPFPGFVDIGCGNGLLVYILRKEGYAGWGFDARKRKSWENYIIEEDGGSDKKCNTKSLQQRVLLPSIIGPAPKATVDANHTEEAGSEEDMLHDGLFPAGTFIISNHADELTPWTPILAALSECPFIMIPCCSHDLSGARFRAPAPPKQKGKSASAYSSLVEWVCKIGTDCGWEIEKEMLRIPSTRNTCLLGRRRIGDFSSISLTDVVEEYGGAQGYADNVMKLVSTKPRGH